MEFYEKKVDYADIEKTYQNLNEGMDPNHYEVLGQEIIKNLKTYGLGVLPKSDLEGLIFHCICNAIEPEFNDDIQKLDYAPTRVERDVSDLILIIKQIRPPLIM